VTDAKCVSFLKSTHRFISFSPCTDMDLTDTSSERRDEQFSRPAIIGVHVEEVPDAIEPTSVPSFKNREGHNGLIGEDGSPESEGDGSTEQSPGEFVRLVH
jgi:hypothetical protein